MIKKITHQEGIAKIVFHILKLSPGVITIFQKGNPFDKLLRSYAERNSNGENLYNNDKRRLIHYQFSIAAHNYYKKYNSFDKLHAEHVVPLSLIQKELLEIKNSNPLKGTDLLKVIDTLKEKNKVVIITKAEQKKIDCKHKSKMPHTEECRLKYHGIFIHPETSHRTLICK